MNFGMAIDKYIIQMKLDDRQASYLKNWVKESNFSTNEISQLFKNGELIGPTRKFLRQYFEERPNVVALIEDFLIQNNYPKTPRNEIIKFASIYNREEILVLLLKYLQGPARSNSRTRENIAQYFRTSTNTINKYITELQFRTKIFGESVSLSVLRGSNEPDSSVHPVFLPMNLVEIYSLLSVLKQQGEDDARSRILGLIADKIYAQLTCYAKEKISGLFTQGEEFHDVERRYNSVNIENFDEAIIFARKEPRAYTIKYLSGNDREEEFTGTVVREPDDSEAFITVLGNHGEKIKILWRKILDIY